MQKITLKDLKEKKACTEGLEYFEKMYGEECAIAEFIKTEHPSNYVCWMISDCEYCQTPDFITYFKSLNPTSEDVRWLICWCSYCQTPEIKEMLMEGL